MVYPESPASKGGIQPEDRILAINELKIKSIDDAIQAVNNAAPESNVTVRIARKDQASDLTLTAAQLPTSVPAELPSGADLPKPALDAKSPAGETTDVVLPEFPHSCKAYVPSSAGRSSLGVLLWVVAADEGKPDEVIRQWQKACDHDGLILIVPRPKDADHWERVDLEYLHRVLERVMTQYKIDPRRVVVGGQGNIGSIAWPLGFAGREVVRGIAVAGSPAPRQTKVPPTDPAQRLAIFAALPSKKDTAATMARGLKSVQDAGYNVTTITTSTNTGQLSDAQREELARWIDTLDRF
jgi:hypothetical protein